MKLKLDRYKDVSILAAQGPVDDQNFAILKAGIRKLFRDGKNKIILELPDSSHFTPEILREIAMLNLIAAELSGQIVLADIEPLIRAKIESFAKPPHIRSFAKREEALAFFHPEAKDELAIAPAPAATVPAAAASAPKTAPAAAASPAPSAPAGASLSREELRTQELGDIGSLRRKLSDLESENLELKDLLRKDILEQRAYRTDPALRDRVEYLEKQLEEALNQVESLSSKGASPKS